MSDLQAVQQITDERADFTLLAYVPVALPLWRLRLRLDVLARRPISPLEEFVMRAAQEANPALRQIQALLGLDDHTLEATVLALTGQEWAKVIPGDELRLTARGKEIAQTARAERAETRVVEVDYDGLLRRPLLLDVPVDSRQQRSLGLRELPAHPAIAPDLVELHDRLPELQKIVRGGGDGRDQEVDLLAIKGILRTDRVYRQAMLVVLRGADKSIQAAPVIDGVVSDEHERALAEPGVARQLRLASELRRGPRHTHLLPAALRELHDPTADRQARRARDQARQARQGNEPDAQQLWDAAEAQTARLPVRQTLPHEHLPLVRAAFRAAQHRLVIATPRISAATVDRNLLSLLEGALDRDVEIEISHNHTTDDPPPHWLSTLADDHAGLRVTAGDTLRHSTLIQDDALGLRTTFPLLAHIGYRRPFRDERGWLVRRPEHVAVLVRSVAPAKADPER